ncbi:MAG TPA: DUF3592 domain-containing protein [Anaerolineales bacterium]|jgi:hypothetical protein|nr:DUF3592 domain-containing protein [Anaerolineales bacterium]
MNTELLLTAGIIVFVLLILNVVFLGIIFFMRRRMATVRQWPSTMGTVNTSYLERRSSGDGSANYPVVQYSYQVGGQMYQGMKIAPGPEVGGTGAGKVVGRYPAGAQVMVFYNPQNAADAVLETKAPAQWVLWLILIVFDIALCAVIPIVWWSMRQ